MKPLIKPFSILAALFLTFWLGVVQDNQILTVIFYLWVLFFFLSSFIFLLIKNNFIEERLKSKDIEITGKSFIDKLNLNLFIIYVPIITIMVYHSHLLGAALIAASCACVSVKYRSVVQASF